MNELTGKTERPAEEGAAGMATLLARYKRARWAVGIVILLAIPIWVLISSSSAPPDGPSRPGGGGVTTQWQGEFLTNAIDGLESLEEFNYDQMLPELLDRLLSEEGPRSLEKLVKDDALLATWIVPDMLRQIVNRLNQWAREQEAPAGWEPDPLVAALPESARELPEMQGLGDVQFTIYDAFALREAVWLRDVANWARGEELGELARAERLFDWTVRNVQLEDNAPDRLPLLPWEVLLFGRGTAVERGRLFILLTRQQGLDAAMLALADPENPLAAPQPWAVGVLCEGEVYLFDPVLGLPLPAQDGIELGDDGQLAIHPATLAQAAASDELLRRLDFDAANPYPVRAADLEHVVVALLEASPAYLACRMAMIESRLTGEQKVVLSADPSAQAERFAAAEGIKAVRLWTLPYDTLRTRRRVDVASAGRRLFEAWPLFAIPGTPLYKGRLQYLEGRLSGSHSAAWYFQAARPSFEQLAQAKQALTQARIAAAKQQVAELPPEERQAALARATQEASQRASLETAVFATAKQHASYWLGLTAFSQPNYPSAIDYFAERTLGASPDGPWTHGAYYNLGRAYEATRQYDDAIEQYIVDSSAPGHMGSFLRARWLRELVATSAPPPGEPEPGETEPGEPVEPEPEAPEPVAPEPKPVAPTPGGPAVELPGAVPPLIEPTPGLPSLPGEGEMPPPEPVPGLPGEGEVPPMAPIPGLPGEDDVPSVPSTVPIPGSVDEAEPAPDESAPPPPGETETPPGEPEPVPPKESDG